MIRICKLCKKAFKTEDGLNEFCSIEHRKIYNYLSTKYSKDELREHLYELSLKKKKKI